jgi:hypothetical protein
MSRTLLQVTVLAVAVSTLMAAAQAPKLDEVTARLRAYVAHYGTQLASVVAEETYLQAVDQAGKTIEIKERFNRDPGGSDQYGPPGRTFSSTRPLSDKRRLRSDYALTRVNARGGWVGYRDTFEVDGLALRDREERLQRLLAGGDVNQAAQIAAQNARFNLAADLLTRNINVPTFALELLHPSNRERFSVRRSGSETINGQAGWVIEFRERGKPTIVRTPGGRDQPSRVLAVVDPLTGTVLKTTLSWEDVTGSIVVTYGLVPRIPVPVPLTMSEQYTTRTGVQIAGEAVYSNYRQFETSGRVINR